MMQARAYCHEVESDVAGNLDRDDLLKTVASLRNDVCSVTADIREVLSENMKLKKEVDKLRGRHNGKQKFSEIHRIKDDVDRLVRMYETASIRQARPRQETQREVSDENVSADRSSWMKKMMMFMMMTELV
jgi:regulator of replication initiation timing